MNHYFTPSQKRGKDFQLFLPYVAILKEEAASDKGPKPGMDMSIPTQQVAAQVAKEQNESPEAIKDLQTKELEKKKAKHVLKLDDKDIDDTMNGADYHQHDGDDHFEGNDSNMI